MASLRDIKRRIKSVKNTQQITKAMKMVSAAKLRRAEEEIKAARPYAFKMAEVINHLASRGDSEGHPLLKRRGVVKRELVIITSDRGLCGGFNSNILKKAEGIIRESKRANIELSFTLIGRKAVSYFKRRGYKIRKEYLNPGRIDYSWAGEVGKAIVGGYAEGLFDEVLLIFGEFKSIMVQHPIVKILLPVEIEEIKGEGFTGDYIFEPSEKAILDQLLPKYVEVLIFRALLESAASEHGARMTAMDSASKNASEMIGRLTLYYNRARQAAITKELMDIVNGVESMKKRTA